MIYHPLKVVTVNTIYNKFYYFVKSSELLKLSHITMFIGSIEDFKPIESYDGRSIFNKICITLYRLLNCDKIIFLFIRHRRSSLFLRHFRISTEWLSGLCYVFVWSYIKVIWGRCSVYNWSFKKSFLMLKLYFFFFHISDYFTLLLYKWLKGLQDTA